MFNQIPNNLNTNNTIKEMRQNCIDMLHCLQKLEEEIITKKTRFETEKHPKKITI